VEYFPCFVDDLYVLEQKEHEIKNGVLKMVAARSTLEFGKDWKGMLSRLAEAECLVDVYLCASAYGHSDDREEMVAETHGVRIIYVGEDYFIVGPRRPVHSSVIPMGWISMIRIRYDDGVASLTSLVSDDESNDMLSEITLLD